MINGTGHGTPESRRLRLTIQIGDSSIIDTSKVLMYLYDTMSKITRFGVSLDSELLRRFDGLIGNLGYENRSEAIRDLIRDRLVTKEWEGGNAPAVGVLTLVYNHEAHELTETLNAIQHRHIDLIVASTHIHLDSHNCLEVIIMKGPAALIKKTSDKLIITKNVKHGRLLTTTTGCHID
jgi:CopG family nickel-responsive transcriptional regulator